MSDLSAIRFDGGSFRRRTSNTVHNESWEQERDWKRDRAGEKQKNAFVVIIDGNTA